MKKAFFILVVICIASLVSSAQKPEATTCFTVEANSLAELNEIKWNKIPKIFEDNEPNDSITIEVACNIPDELIATKKAIRITGEFKIRRNCLTSEVKEAVEDIKKTSLAILELETKLNKK